MIVAIPEVAPITSAVAAPNASILVAVAFKSLNAVRFVVTSPPSIFKSPSRSTVALRIVAMPEVAPTTRFVAAPNAFTLVAVVFKRLNSV